MQQEIFAVVGGDLRQAWLAGRLAERGSTVYSAPGGKTDCPGVSGKSTGVIPV